jgi:hypothetical protein
MYKFEELFCDSKCKDYYHLDLCILNVIKITNPNILEMKMDEEWNTLFDFVFNSKLCLYLHRRDEIGIEIAWLYEIYCTYKINKLNFIKNLITIEHLSNLHFFFT